MDRTLERDLILEFATRPPIARAYLAEVAFDAGEPAVALCIWSDRGEDRALVVRIGEMYRRRFGVDAFIDIVFLSEEEERDVAAVCRPFYSRPG